MKKSITRTKDFAVRKRILQYESFPVAVDQNDN